MLDPSVGDEWFIWYVYLPCACVGFAAYVCYAYAVTLPLKRKFRSTLQLVGMAAAHYHNKIYTPKGYIGLFFLFMSALGYRGYLSEFTLLSVFFLYHFFVASDIVMLEKMYKTFYEKKAARVTRAAERAKVDRLYE